MLIGVVFVLILNSASIAAMIRHYKEDKEHILLVYRSLLAHLLLDVPETQTAAALLQSDYLQRLIDASNGNRHDYFGSAIPVSHFSVMERKDRHRHESRPKYGRRAATQQRSEIHPFLSVEHQCPAEMRDPFGDSFA